jgi:hypothetical protein
LSILVMERASRRSARETSVRPGAISLQVKAISDKVRDAYALVDELHDAGIRAEHPAMVKAKTLRIEVLQIKADLERELGGWLLDCVVCKRRVQLGVRDGSGAGPGGSNVGGYMIRALMTDGSDTTRLARVLAWLVAIPLFAATVITVLLELEITASPPREGPPNDLLEGTRAFFENETDRWPQELASLLLFTVGFLALIGLVALLRKVVSLDDPRMTIGTLAVGVGAGLGATGQLFFLGAKEVAIDPHYCDCARAAEQIISRGQALDMVENAQQWLVVGFLVLASVGLFLIWRVTTDRGLFSSAWRGLTLGIALVLILAVIARVVEQDDLSDVFIALGGGVLTPIWAVTLARRLPGAV